MSIQAFDLSEILQRAAQSSRDDSDDRASSPPDVLCITLSEIAQRYAAPCPFKPGDLVTPRKGYNKKGAGQPHIVLEVFEEPVRTFDTTEDMADTGSPFFGAKLDMRIACEVSGVIMAYCTESWNMEPYTGPGSDARPF